MENNPNKNEEVDLVTILNALKIPVLALWHFVLHSLHLMKKRWIILFIFTAIGVGIGVGLFKVSKPVYASTLVLSSSTLSNDFCADIIGNLDILIKDATPELIAKKLRIPIASARNLKGLEFDNYNELIKKKSEDKDTIVLGRPFKIKAYSSSTTLFDTLQTALVNYLENNEYSLRRREIKRDNLVKLREKLREDIHQIDSLKYSIALSSMSKGSQTNIIVSKSGEAPSFNDPLSVFKEGITLYKEELTLDASLILIENIQVIQDFSPRAKPDSTIFKFMLKYGLPAFFLGLITIFIFESWKNRKKENS